MTKIIRYQTSLSAAHCVAKEIGLNLMAYDIGNWTVANRLSMPGLPGDTLSVTLGDRQQQRVRWERNAPSED